MKKLQKIFTPLRYPGGKHRAASKILDYIDDDFSEYREPFLRGASVFIKLKQFDNTNKIIENLLELDTKYARVYYLKACLNSAQNNKLEAIKELKLALNLDKNLLNDAKTDPDLKNIRESKEFKDLMCNFN